MSSGGSAFMARQLSSPWQRDRGFESPSLQQRVRQLAEDGAQPAIYYTRRATRWQPYVKGLTIIVNSIYNGWRMEDVWLDK